MERFTVYPCKGFQIKFDNGYEVSVMFGSGNYCEHRFGNVPTGEIEANTFIGHSSKDCEVAVFDKVDNYVTGRFTSIAHKVDPQGMVAGWVTPGELAELMAEVANYKG